MLEWELAVALQLQLRGTLNYNSHRSEMRWKSHEDLILVSVSPHLPNREPIAAGPHQIQAMALHRAPAHQ